MVSRLWQRTVVARVGRGAAQPSSCVCSWALRSFGMSHVATPAMERIPGHDRSGYRLGGRTEEEVARLAVVGSDPTIAARVFWSCTGLLAARRRALRSTLATAAWRSVFPIEALRLVGPGRRAKRATVRPVTATPDVHRWTWPTHPFGPWPARMPTPGRLGSEQADCARGVGSTSVNGPAGGGRRRPRWMANCATDRAASKGKITRARGSRGGRTRLGRRPGRCCVRAATA